MFSVNETSIRRLCNGVIEGQMIVKRLTGREIDTERDIQLPECSEPVILIALNYGFL